MGALSSPVEGTEGWVEAKAWEKRFNKASLWSCATLNMKLCLVCENQAALCEQGGPQQKSPAVPG